MVRFHTARPYGVCCRNKHQLVVGWNENMITGKSVVQCEFKFRMNANKFYTIKYQQGSFHHFYFYQPISNCYIYQLFGIVSYVETIQYSNPFFYYSRRINNNTKTKSATMDSSNKESSRNNKSRSRTSFPRRSNDKKKSAVDDDVVSNATEVFALLH